MRTPPGSLVATASAAALLTGGLCACELAANQKSAELVVQQDGRTVSHFSLLELLKLPQVEIPTPQSRGAQVQKGPVVRSILNAANVIGFDRIRVEGRDPAQTLSAAELGDQVILNITRRNTLKLAGTRLGIDRWVRDVTTLVVNP